MGFCPLFPGFMDILPIFFFRKTGKNGEKVAICPGFAHF